MGSTTGERAPTSPPDISASGRASEPSPADDISKRVSLALGRLVFLINGATTEQAIYGLVAERIHEIFPADRVSVALRSEQPDVVTILALEGQVPTDLPSRGQTLPIAGTAIDAAMSGQRTLLWSPDDSDYAEAPKVSGDGLRSVLNAPLITPEGALGTLNIASRQEGAYANTHRMLLSELALVVATGVHRHRLLEASRQDANRLRKQARRLEGLGELARRLSSTTREADVFDVVAMQVGEAASAERVSFGMVEADLRSVRILAASGPQLEHRERVPVGTIVPIAAFATVLASAEPVYANISRSDTPQHKALAAEGIVSSVSCRVMSCGEVMGVINVGLSRDVAGDEDLSALVGATARVVATALERIRAEEVMRRAQKTEGLGILAGGLAHDFNNLLGAAMSNLSIVQDDLRQDHPMQPELNDIGQALDRGAELTQQMLTYAGSGPRHPVALDFHKMLLATGRMARASVPKNVEMVFKLCDGAPSVVGDEGQLSQIILNLITNAAAAMQNNGGAITLGTRIDEVAMPYRSRIQANVEVPAGRYLLASCTDDGCGIRADQLEKIFDPFFTTKSSGHGLGLSAVLGIVRAHRGDIRVESSTSGTRFEVLLPISVEVARAPAKAAASTRGLALVVDDDQLIQVSCRRMLERLGFEVIVASDGIAGVEAYRRVRDRLSLVILDQSMPRMTGAQAVSHMVGVPIIMVTGYDRTATLDTLPPGSVQAVLSKPYRLGALRRVIDAVLG